MTKGPLLSFSSSIFQHLTVLAFPKQNFFCSKLILTSIPIFQTTLMFLLIEPNVPTATGMTSTFWALHATSTESLLLVLDTSSVSFSLIFLSLAEAMLMIKTSLFSSCNNIWSPCLDVLIDVLITLNRHIPQYLDK